MEPKTPATPETDGTEVSGTFPAKEKRRSLRPPLHVLREVILRNGGICSGIASACGVADRTVRSWRERDPAVAEIFTEARERIVDMAEGVIVKSLKAGNLTAAIYVTKCHGSRRGWIERHNVEVESVDPKEREKRDSIVRQLLADPEARREASKLISMLGQRASAKVFPGDTAPSDRYAVVRVVPADAN